MNTKAPNIAWHQATVTREARERQTGSASAVLWFTGLSGSGKSTLAHAVEDELYRIGCRTFVLDGDNVRHGLCGDLGFTDADRKENIRRVGEVSKLFVEAGVVVLTAFISPFQADRERVRALMGEFDFIEIYCQSPIEVCEARDVKGLYKKAREGAINDFTGVSSLYEEPSNPDLVVDTANASIEQCVAQILEYLKQKKKMITGHDG
jgi:adenylylsulfate kinase